MCILTWVIRCIITYVREGIQEVPSRCVSILTGKSIPRVPSGTNSGFDGCPFYNVSFMGVGGRGRCGNVRVCTGRRVAQTSLSFESGPSVHDAEMPRKGLGSREANGKDEMSQCRRTPRCLDQQNSRLRRACIRYRSRCSDRDMRASQDEQWPVVVTKRDEGTRDEGRRTTEEGTVGVVRRAWTSDGHAVTDARRPTDLEPPRTSEVCSGELNLRAVRVIRHPSPSPCVVLPSPEPRVPCPVSRATVERRRSNGYSMRSRGRPYFTRRGPARTELKPCKAMRSLQVPITGLGHGRGRVSCCYQAERGWSGGTSFC